LRRGTHKLTRWPLLGIVRIFVFLLINDKYIIVCVELTSATKRHPLRDALRPWRLEPAKKKPTSDCALRQDSLFRPSCVSRRRCLFMTQVVGQRVWTSRRVDDTSGSPAGPHSLTHWRFRLALLCCWRRQKQISQALPLSAARAWNWLP